MAHDHDVLMTLADTAVELRDADALRQYAPLLEELAARDGHRLYRAIAHRAWGVAHRLAGDHAESEVRFNRATELFRELGTRWQIGRTLFEMAELDLARSNADAAREYFSRALAAFEELQAVPDAARTRARLKSLG